MSNNIIGSGPESVYNVEVPPDKLLTVTKVDDLTTVHSGEEPVTVLQKAPEIRETTVASPDPSDISVIQSRIESGPYGSGTGYINKGPYYDSVTLSNPIHYLRLGDIPPDGTIPVNLVDERDASILTATASVGTVYAMSSLAPNEIDTAMYLPDIDGGTHVSLESVEATPTGGFTIEFIIRNQSAANAWRPIFSWVGNTVENSFVIWLQDGDKSFNLSSYLHFDDLTEASVEGPNLAAVNYSAHHVIVIFDPSTPASALRLIVNGETVETASSDGKIPNVSSTAYVGQIHSGGSLGGYLEATVDELAIYDRPITYSEIINHYNASGIND